jgi:adenylate cyclase
VSAQPRTQFGMQMTTRESDALQQSRQLQFDRYVLNLDRGCLLFEGNEIALRPKTFAVLQYLNENAGRLISKDELFGAVWPDVAVSDDALVQSITELRRALGDDGPRLIKTVPRRGYRFEPNVSAAGVLPQPLTATTSVTTGDGVETASTTRNRPGSFVASAIVILFVAGVPWINAHGGSKIQSISGYTDESALRNLEFGTKPTIAILPLADQSDDTTREYFADGLTQDIITALGRFTELTVMSWNAVSPFKGKLASPGEIARSLAVRYQVEGSVRRAGERVRVTAQLVNADGRVIWSGRFDEVLSNLFVLQDKITDQIAGALAIGISQAEQLRALAKPTNNLEAYDYVLRARPASLRPTRANVVEARTLLRHAIELDPNYSTAYAALAETYHSAVSMGWAESPVEFLDRANEMANKALSLNESDVRAHVILGRIHLFYHRYGEAKAELDQAIAVNPSDSNGLAGRGNILVWSGQTDAAIDTLELAQRIDPELNAFDRFALSLAYYLKGRYDAAIEQAELNLRKTSGANFSRIVLAAAYAEQSRAEEAARIVTTISRIDPTFDPNEFGTKFLNSADLEHLRDGLRKAGLSAKQAGPGR